MKLKLATSLVALVMIATSGLHAYESAATNTVLLDVRTAAEFEKGRIPHAINIDINSPKFAEQIAALDTNMTYLVNCAVGMRSARACKKMETLGFGKLYDLAPGFDGWKKALKPVEKVWGVVCGMSGARDSAPDRFRRL